MASNTFTHATADGKTTRHSREGTQGAPRKPDEIKKIRKNITVSKQGYVIAKQKAKSLNMSVSAFYDLAGTLYNIGVYNNC